MSTQIFDEFASAVRDRAIALNGQTVTVHLVGGQSLTGTLTFVAQPLVYPPGATEWPKVLTVTVASKVHSVRLDHVSIIGQG